MDRVAHEAMQAGKDRATANRALLRSGDLSGEIIRECEWRVIREPHGTGNKSGICDTCWRKYNER